jgi:predicted nucleic acid-binding protein
MKLPFREAEHTALRRALRGSEGLVSSALLAVEARRAAARYGVLYIARAEKALGGVALVAIDDPVVESAARLEPPELRSLDAIHLATALSLGDDLGAMYVYDDRLAGAAREVGIRVESPV